MHDDNDDGKPPVGFIPRHRREQTEREEKLRAGLFAVLDDERELQEMVASLVHAVVLLVALRWQDGQRARVAEGALERAMDEIIAFEARCACGDERGAVDALRGWIARVAG